MKTKPLLVSIAFLFIFNSGFSQSGKVSERKLMGEWQLIIDIEDAMDEAKQELREEENVLGEWFVGAISGIVETALENIEIYFVFEPDGVMRIYTNEDDDDDVDDATWFINRSGYLVIDSNDDGDNISIDDTDYWLMRGNKLIPVDEDEDGEKENVYLMKIE
jgi:hypothetical protein